MNKLIVKKNLQEASELIVKRDISRIGRNIDIVIDGVYYGKRARTDR